MKKLMIVGVAAAVCLLAAAGVQAQVLPNAELFVPIPELSPDAAYQDHERFEVGLATTPIGAPSHGWILGPTLAGETRLGGRNGKTFGGGKALVVLGGKPWIQVAGGPIDDIPMGSGYAASFVMPVSEIQFEVITSRELTIEVQGFFLHQPMAPPQKFTVKPGDNVLRLGTNGIFWDTIHIRSTDTGPGWGLDNVGVGRKMLARPVICREQG